jgi:hypothetical protein
MPMCTYAHAAHGISTRSSSSSSSLADRSQNARKKLEQRRLNYDVFRRMQDIKESEVEMVQDLTAFLEAELTYYDRCREILINVKREWPVQ